MKRGKSLVVAVAVLSIYILTLYWVLGLIFSAEETLLFLATLFLAIGVLLSLKNWVRLTFLGLLTLGCLGVNYMGGMDPGFGKIMVRLKLGIFTLTPAIAYIYYFTDPKIEELFATRPSEKIINKKQIIINRILRLLILIILAILVIMFPAILDRSVNMIRKLIL